MSDLHDESLWPIRIRRLPRAKNGLPIPYTAYIDGNGVPDFRILDAPKRLKCLRDRLCGICGTKLEYWIVFIGGPVSCTARQFLDPAMHPECADFSLRYCPHLARPKSHYSTRPVPTEIQQSMVMSDIRPDKFGRYRTRSYRMYMRDNDQLALADAPVEITWHSDKSVPKGE